MDVWDVYSLFAAFLVAKYFLGAALVWLKIFQIHVFSKIFCKPTDLAKKYGKWAVVTGSSNGIGKNYAKELASRGINLVLISNEDEKLHEVSKEIETDFGVETKVIVADFSLTEDEHQKIFKAIEGLEIGILVNNVGTARGLPNKFEDMTRQQIWDLVMINVCAATSMAHFILPKMKISGRGIIINIASIAALSPTPYGTLYGASKAYMKSFSDALKSECKGSGVEIQTVCPGFVDTKIIESNAGSQPSMFFPPPEIFAKNAVATIGFASTTAGCLPHDIQYAALESLPSCAATWIAKKFLEVKDFDKKTKEN